uniref:Groucho/TLE N-terminal Q-rich domain-containing protein n=1 Tax=Meloidogyne incognita TaxID=6306 RepID=A0A914KL25_MELIC
MFPQNRHNTANSASSSHHQSGTSGPGVAGTSNTSGMKLGATNSGTGAVKELLDKVYEEFGVLQQQLHNTRIELEKCQQEKDGLQRYSMMMNESLFSLNMETQKHIEIGKRLSGILTHVIPMLPQEHQGSAVSAIERAKAVGPQELLTNHLQQQQLAAMMSVAGPAAAAAAFNPAMMMAGMFVQNDDAGSSAALSHHTNGRTSQPFHKGKDERDTASASSRDSATPRSGKLQVAHGEQIAPVSFPPDASLEPDVPKGLRRIGDLPHGDVVCAVTLAKDGRRVFTGGKGACLKDSYIRSCKLFSDGSTLIVGGETKTICILDVERGGEIKQTFDCEAEACYALAISQDCKTLFSCCSNGVVNVWDLTCGERIVQLIGHSDGASCVDISGDGQKLWTGGLDNTVRCWDIGARQQLESYMLESQIFSLGCCPTENWVAVGLEDSNVQVLNSEPMSEKYLISAHQSCVLSLKFANSGKWFVSTGKDNVVNCWRTPYGYRLIKTKEMMRNLIIIINIWRKKMKKRFFFNFGVQYARVILLRPPINNCQQQEGGDIEKEISELPLSDKQDNNKANNSDTNSVSDEIEESKETFNLKLEQTLDEFLEKLKLMGFEENNEKINQKIKETEKDFENLQKQLDSTKKELKKCQEGRDGLQRYSMMMNELLFSLNMETQKHIEIGKRLSGILTHVIPMLPQEQQGSALSAIEMAKSVGPQENKQGNLFQQSCLSKIMPGLMNSLANQAANFNAQLLNILNKDALTLSNNLSKNPSLDTSATNNPWSFLTSMPSSMLIPSSSSSSVPPTNSGNKTSKPLSEQTSSLTNKPSAYESALKEFLNGKSSNETLEKTGKKLGNKPEPNYAFKIVPSEEIIPVVFPSDASSEPDLPK